MGHLLYGSPPVDIELDDRTLAHIEVVVFAKLRRNESFAFSVTADDGKRSAIWVNPSSTIRFEYDDAAQPLNREWLEQLIDSANTPPGLKITPEPTKD